jgi:hypothetical protein
MAEIVELKERLEKQPKRDHEPCEARVILFTGVRYERLTDNHDQPRTRSAGTRRKKS